MLFLRVIFLICLTTLLAACNTTQPIKQTFDVVSPARFITKNEAVAFISASDNFEETRLELDNIHYAKGGDDKTQTNLPIPTLHIEGFSVRVDESLQSTALRLAHQGGFSRLVVDIENPSLLTSSKSNDAVNVVGGVTLVNEVAHVYKTSFPNLRFYRAGDANNQALVLSDKALPYWQKLKIVDVQAGMLSKNTQMLADVFGWKIAWESDDYVIEYGYPLIVKEGEVRDALTTLLQPYNITPVLNPNTKHVQVMGSFKAQSTYSQR